MCCVYEWALQPLKFVFFSFLINGFMQCASFSLAVNFQETQKTPEKQIGGGMFLIQAYRSKRKQKIVQPLQNKISSYMGRLNDLQFGRICCFFKKIGSLQLMQSETFYFHITNKFIPFVFTKWEQSMILQFRDSTQLNNRLIYGQSYPLQHLFQLKWMNNYLYYFNAFLLYISSILHEKAS